MAEMHNVVIGIQARSTSERFPRKVFELIDGKPMLQHVVDAANKCAQFMNHRSHSHKTLVQVVVLIPDGDPIRDAFRKHVKLWEGPEHDVLTRYKGMADRYEADYVVRVTADCPLIPPFLISKHINTAVQNGNDYTANVEDDMRTAPDGYDCEVMSKRLLDYVDKSAVDPRHREHVTLMIREGLRPDWIKCGAVIGHRNESHLKYSVDTEEDLMRVREEYRRLKEALKRGEERYGKQNVHKF